ncbi:hypothetical protein ACG83_06290 [Frankia sp. R43]|nr:hypothetical protein ACG83_06290 [Frankia sp. R43]
MLAPASLIWSFVVTKLWWSLTSAIGRTRWLVLVRDPGASSLVAVASAGVPAPVGGKSGSLAAVGRQGL